MKEETHTACQRRLKKEGGKSRCCYCEPHEDCEWEKEVKEFNTLEE